jgi:hypothetical protein
MIKDLLKSNTCLLNLFIQSLSDCFNLGFGIAEDKAEVFPG